MNEILQSAEILRTPKHGSFDEIFRRAHINVKPYSHVGTFDQESAPRTLIQVNGQLCSIPTSGAYAPNFTKTDRYPNSVISKSPFNQPAQKYYTSERDIHPALLACSAFASGKCTDPTYRYTNVQQIIYP